MKITKVITKQVKTTVKKATIIPTLTIAMEVTIKTILMVTRDMEIIIKRSKVRKILRITKTIPTLTTTMEVITLTIRVTLMVTRVMVTTTMEVTTLTIIGAMEITNKLFK